jgi:hypothetical protein
MHLVITVHAGAFPRGLGEIAASSRLLLAAPSLHSMAGNRVRNSESWVEEGLRHLVGTR